MDLILAWVGVQVNPPIIEIRTCFNGGLTREKCCN